MSAPRRTLVRLLGLLALVLALVAAPSTASVAVAAAPEPAHLRGTVVDVAGRAVAGIAVRAYTDCVRGCDQVTAVSDAAGRYDLAFVHPVASPDQYCLQAAGSAIDGYATVVRHTSVRLSGKSVGCTQTVRAGDQLTEPAFVLSGDGTPVRNLATAYFVGTPKVGYTLSARPGRWNASGVVVTYQWSDGARQIGTGATYAVQPGELGHRITITATAQAPGRTPTALSWTKADPAVAGTFWMKNRPRITGSAKVGRTLRAKTGVVVPGVSRTYRWYRNGHAIRGAVKSTYRVSRADRGKRLTVRVHWARTAYTSTSRTSPKSARVR